MAWHIVVWHWLAHAAVSGFVVLIVGCTAVRVYRQPVRKLRVAELTLFGCLVVPWVYLIPGAARWSLGWLEAVPASASVELAPAMDGPSPAFRVRPPTSPVLPPDPVVARLERDSVAVAPPASLALAPDASPSPPAFQSMPVALFLVVAYLALAGGHAVWWLMGMAALRRLRRAADPVPPEVVTLFEELAGPASRGVRLAASDAIELPLTFGWRRPVIVLPGALCRTGDTAALRWCLAHEWSHVERHDIAAWHLAALVQVLCAYQPLFWWLRGQLRLCQDYLADNCAAEQTAHAADYAEFLVGLARRRLHPAGLALGIGARRSSLYRRVAMLVAARQPLERRCRRLWTAAATVSAALVLIAVASIRLDTAARAEDKEAAPAKDAAKGEPIAYTGRVFDKVTGKSIEGATVTVRRSILRETDQDRLLQETKHRTNAEGKYSFVIPPEQAAERYLFIELAVEAPAYAPPLVGGYGFAMIRKNEKLGGRPFFEKIAMPPGKEITGVVETPDGKPAAGVKVLAFSNANSEQWGEAFDSFAHGKTDAAGRFRLWLITPGSAVFWLLPKDYAPSTHVLKDPNQRGDRGKFALQPGLTLKGKLLDAQGKPLAGVFVNASRTDRDETFNLSVADQTRRTALTNERGEFRMKPLPPGRYQVMPQESDAEWDKLWPKKRPVPAVFVPMELTLKAGAEPAAIEVRAVPHVVVEAQYYDGKGKKSTGHNCWVTGQVDRTQWFVGRVDADGKMTIRVPRGLTDTKMEILTNEHGVLRFRAKPGDPLRHDREINLGTLNDDVKGIEIVRYVAPILLVDARDKAGKQIADFHVEAVYQPGVIPKRPGERFVNDVKGDVSMEKQEDGRWRTESMLPDEKVTVTVSAKGCKSVTQKFKLPEGATKELQVVLEK